MSNNARISLNKAVYNYRIKGYLTTADIINHVSQGVEQIENSDFLKKELFDKLQGDELKALDKDVAKQLK